MLQCSSSDYLCVIAVVGGKMKEEKKKKTKVMQKRRKIGLSVRVNAVELLIFSGLTPQVLFKAVD